MWFESLGGLRISEKRQPGQPVITCLEGGLVGSIRTTGRDRYAVHAWHAPDTDRAPPACPTRSGRFDMTAKSVPINSAPKALWTPLANIILAQLFILANYRQRLQEQAPGIRAVAGRLTSVGQVAAYEGRLLAAI